MRDHSAEIRRYEVKYAKAKDEKRRYKFAQRLLKLKTLQGNRIRQ